MRCHATCTCWTNDHRLRCRALLSTLSMIFYRSHECSQLLYRESVALYVSREEHLACWDTTFLSDGMNEVVSSFTVTMTGESGNFYHRTQAYILGSMIRRAPAGSALSSWPRRSCSHVIDLTSIAPVKLLSNTSQRSWPWLFHIVPGTGVDSSGVICVWRTHARGLAHTKVAEAVHCPNAAWYVSVLERFIST